LKTIIAWQVSEAQGSQACQANHPSVRSETALLPNKKQSKIRAAKKTVCYMSDGITVGCKPGLGSS